MIYCFNSFFAPLNAAALGAGTMTVKIGKFIWDITYACPLRCRHCYSESGRRPARTLDRDNAMRVVDFILAARAEKVSISGGEPLSVRWAVEAMKRLRDAGVAVTVFTSGWSMQEKTAIALADAASSVALSIDGADAAIHDAIRARAGAFERGMKALDVLHRVRDERRASRPPGPRRPRRRAAPPPPPCAPRCA